MTMMGMKDMPIGCGMALHHDIAVVLEREPHWESNVLSDGRWKDAQTTHEWKMERYRRFYVLLLTQLPGDQVERKRGND